MGDFLLQVVGRAVETAYAAHSALLAVAEVFPFFQVAVFGIEAA